jgi:selT/selW/selH-like putative selenoprotein
LKNLFGVESELERSSGGVFEVAVDGALVLSKKKLGRFPEVGEVEELLQQSYG